MSSKVTSKKQRRRNGKLSKELVMQAIEQETGIITYVAERLGCDRKTVYNYIEKYPEIKALHEQQRTVLVDVAERRLLDKIGQGDVTSIIFTLKTQGKSRGYVERTEQQIEADHTIQVVYEKPEWQTSDSNTRLNGSNRLKTAQRNGKS